MKSTRCVLIGWTVFHILLSLPSYKQNLVFMFEFCVVSLFSVLLSVVMPSFTLGAYHWHCSIGVVVCVLGVMVSAFRQG